MGAGRRPLDSNSAFLIWKIVNRKHLVILLVLYLAFTLYNTFIPFNLRTNGPASVGAALQLVLSTPIVRVSLTDLVGNIILFIPFGILCALIGRRPAGWIVLPVTVMAAFCLSCAIEVTQTFFQDRIASRLDIINNTLGAFGGALVVLLVPETLARRLFHHARTLIHASPWTAVMVAMLVLALLRAWFPFDVAISVSEIKDGLKRAVIFPFQTITLKAWLALSPMPAQVKPFQWTEFISNLWFWGFWGYIATAGLKTAKGSTVFSSSLFRGAALVLPPCLLEAGQLFIGSRTVDINDVIAGIGGAIIGAGYGLLSNQADDAGDHKIKKGLIVPFYAYIVFNGLAPFDFHLPANGIAASLNVRQWVPFYAYFAKTSIWNIYDVAEALLYGAPLGWLLAARSNGTQPRSFRIWQPTIAAMTLGLFIEGCQLFLKTRTADITDPILMAVGAFSAAWLSNRSRL